ncbi:MAG: beta-N-acetylhexosaminidase [Myxococcota bacterium]|nr:beta-N-acetylhexosaminidase [Myxococcota bacterium]
MYHLDKFVESIQDAGWKSSFKGIFFPVSMVVFLVLSPKIAVAESPVDVILESMSQEEKVGQLMMIGFPGKELNRHALKWVGERRVGGVALFGRNIKNSTQVRRYTRQLQGLAEKSGVPIFISLDQEGGNVVRIRHGAAVLPGNMALGATRSPTLAYVAGQVVGNDLRRLGFNMNLAPVLDVNSNPRNPVIGIRSFGESPQLVSLLGTWMVRGLQDMGVVPVAKHFPGHGDTCDDSHFALPSIRADATRLREVELVPFQQAIDAGLDALMTAHIALPKYAEKPDIPATLSRRLLTDELRHKMGFDGVVITDGLEMQGIVESYGSGEAAVRAIQAGADMAMVLWTSHRREEVYRHLLRAVRKGEISGDRLDLSVRRILMVKYRRGLFHQWAEERKPIEKEDSLVHDAVVQRIADESVTLVRNYADLIPVKPERFGKIDVVGPRGVFLNTLSKAGQYSIHRIPSLPSYRKARWWAQRLAEELRHTELLIFAIANTNQLKILRELTKLLPFQLVIGVSLGSPYLIENIPEVDAFLCSYSYQATSQRAAANVLLGKVVPNGRLPVSIPGMFPYGHRAPTVANSSWEFSWISPVDDSTETVFVGNQ